MPRPGRNPRRGYDPEGREIAPMTLANMREVLHARMVAAECRDCLHDATVNVDSLPGETPVPDVALRLRCSSCGSRHVVTRPNLIEMYEARELPY